MSNIVVLKFGGTSVATPEARAAVAARVSEWQGRGDKIVVVVSAMGRGGEGGSPYATDSLLGLVSADTAELAPRELDAIAACGEDLSAAVLASELIVRGLPAVSLRGFQAGIVTDGVFRNARIESIEESRLKRVLDDGRIVVVTGFQGMSADGDITTLGRGGSDTSAVAIGVALGAELVVIYTDVDGVYSADPRIVPEARPIPVLPYREAAELAHGGARVLHPRAAEIAERYGIKVRICNTFSSAPGTLLCTSDEPGASRLDRREDRLARAVTSLPRIAQLALARPDFETAPGGVCEVLEALAAEGLSLDMINIHPDRLVFTVPDNDLERAGTVLAGLDGEVRSVPGCAKVTLVGGGIHGVPGVVARISRLLVSEGIPILQSVDSSTIVSVLVPGADEGRAVRALHTGFLNGNHS